LTPHDKKAIGANAFHVSSFAWVIGVLIAIRTGFFALGFAFFAWIFSTSGWAGWFAFLSLLFGVLVTLVHLREALEACLRVAENNSNKG